MWARPKGRVLVFAETANNIAFDDIDVSSNQTAAQEMIEKSGQMGVPVLDIEGQIITGFDKEAINKALGL